MHITYLYQPGRIARLPELRSGKLPTEFFYGAPELESWGHTISYVEAEDFPARSKTRVAAELLIKLRHLPAKVYFAQLMGVKRVLPQLTNADVIVATTPGLAFSLAIWKSLGAIDIPRDFVGIHCGILNYDHSWARRKFSQRLFTLMRTILYGQGELESMREMFKIPADRIEVNCFGVDDSFWTPASKSNRQDYILAIGNDSRRDYDLLIRAAGALKRPIKILTKRELPSDLPHNIEVVRGSWHEQALSDTKLREMYRSAFCVAVPLIESNQPSGQSVTLQAMACGTPVILTKTTGLWETALLQDGDNIVFTRPGDEVGFIKAIEDLENNPEQWQRLGEGGLQYIRNYGRVLQFAEKMEKLCRQVMDMN
jgi:glycosyltransferase involved in cell wall biosynthesis